MIGIDTEYKISEDIANHSQYTKTAAETKSGLSTYKPLLLIAAFIGGLSVLTADGNLVTGMNIFMAGFFLVFSFFKLLNLKGFADS